VETKTLIEEYVRQTTKQSGVPLKVKRRKVLLDLARLLKR
jgi:hypothetical protein